MKISSFLIAVLIVAVGVLAFYVFYAPPKIVTVVERPVVNYGFDYPVNWVPWSYGRGGWGWPGASYVNRPMPHFYRRPSPPPGPRPGGDGARPGGGGPRPGGGGPRPGGGGPRPGGGGAH
jgi:hypothetical protein